VRALLDFVTPYFDMATLGIVNTHAVEAVKDREVAGWRYYPALTNFWYFRRKA